MKASLNYIIIACIMGLLFSCSTIPRGVTAVSDFEIQKYAGRWYEIARQDFRFEKNMSHVTADYSLNKDGSVRVENQGYDYVQSKWKKSVGKAKPVEAKDVAMLKVSFFGPFYAGYNVVALDPDYKYALVIGDKLSYMWILSREKSIPDEIKKSYLKIATDLGCNINSLIWTLQD